MNSNRMLTAGVVLALGGAAWVTHVSAQNSSQASSGRSATVDVVKMFNEYQLQKDLGVDLDRRKAQLQTEAQERQKKVDQAQAVLDALDANDPTYKPRRDDLLKMQMNNKVWFEIQQAALAQELASWSNQIYRDILATITDVARERGYDLVLYTDAFEPAPDPDVVRERIRARKVVYANPAIDITQTVLDRLNSAYRSSGKSAQLALPAVP